MDGVRVSQPFCCVPVWKTASIIASKDSQRRLVKGYDASSLVSPKEDYLDLVRKLNAHEHGEPKYILVINWTKTKMYNSVDKRPPAILPDHVFKFAYS